MAAEISGRSTVATIGAPGEAPGEAPGGTGGSPAAPRGSAVPAAGRPAQRSSALLTAAYWTTPRRVRALAGLALAALIATAGVAFTVLGGARDGIDAIGHHAAPQAVRTADLYFALNDMDAQTANLLQLGADPGYDQLRRETLATYEQRRAQADADLQQAAEAATGDQAGRAAVQRVLDGLGRYEALTARATLLEDQAKAPVGRPSDAALDGYRQATDLLRQELLPAIDQLTAANSGTVDRVYRAQHDDLAAGWWELLATGGSALVVLALLQWQLSVRYRRTVNPALAGATLLTLLTLAAGLGLAADADQRLTVAKKDAFDSVIALGRARAVAYDLNADESRYLADPARAAAYEQSFLDKSQQVVKVPGSDLAHYDDQLARLSAAHRANHANVPFDGYLGVELRNITFSGEQAAAERVLTAFQQYQADDRKIRELNTQGRLRDAVTFNTGTAAGQSNHDFGLLSAAFDDVIGINATAMNSAVAAADDELDGIALATGAVALAAALALTAAGVGPRLREYR